VQPPALGIIILAALTILATGCSKNRPGEKVVTPTPSTIIGEAPQPPKEEPVPVVYQNGDPASGKAVFTSAGCSACHTLKDAGATGTIGPNLDQAQPELGLAVDRVVHGKAAMPPFKGQLTDKQIADVSAYVIKATA
jgi:mono/diheme cytochrome c family protein